MKVISVIILVILSIPIQAQDIVTLDYSFKEGGVITFIAEDKKYKNVRITAVNDSTIRVTWNEYHWNRATKSSTKIEYRNEINIEDIESLNKAPELINSIYGELLGNGTSLSANYEHLFALSKDQKFHLATSFGIGFIPDVISSTYTQEPRGFATFPLELTMVYMWPQSVEIGAGLTLIPGISWNIFFLRIGYRSVKMKNGFLFRIAYTPFIDEGEFISFWGVSFGKSF